MAIKNSSLELFKEFSKKKESKLVGWNCHCCLALNNAELKQCRVCGRPESYAQDGYPLPLHGSSVKVFRPSQIMNIMSEKELYISDSVKWTALHSASVNGNTPIVIELLNLDCVLDALTDKGQSALHLAVYAGSYDTVVVLIEKGAKINLSTYEEKMTPLHIACQQNWKEIAEYLIKNGANVNALNILHRTPLHFVGESGRSDLGLSLLRAGALPSPVDLHGWSPRQIAELRGHRSFQEMIVQADMTEKQFVIKDLPPADYHSRVWSSLIEMNEIRGREAKREISKWEQAAKETLRFREKQERGAIGLGYAAGRGSAVVTRPHRCSDG